MADPMEALKGILGENAEDTIKDVMNKLSPGEDMGDSNDYLLEMKQLIDRIGSSRSDPRANLLLSLRPYMRSNRKKSIDGAVRLLNLSKLSGLFKI